MSNQTQRKIQGELELVDRTAMAAIVKDDPSRRRLSIAVLQGAQGIGKTQLFRHLAIKEQFFKGGASIDTRSKDSLMSAVKVWICELGEIDSVTKREQSEVKAFLTERIDR